MTIVYKYGLLDPIEGAPHAVFLLERAHSLREKLYAIEVDRRRAVRAAYRLDPECDRLGGLAIEASKAEKAALRALREHKSHGHGGESKDRQARAPLVAAMGEAGQARRDRCTEWGKARMAARRVGAVKAAIDAAATEARARSKAVIAESPLPVTMTDYVRDECVASFDDTPLYDWSYPSDPECRPYDGRGRIGIGWGRVAIKYRGRRDGYTAASLMAGWPDIRLDRPAPAPPEVRVGQKDLRVLRLRIGGEWIAWPMVLHRPLPASARVIGVYIASRVHGGRVHWHACFILDVALPDIDAAPPAWAAIHIGWKREDDGSVLVGTLLGEDGKTETLALSNAEGRYTPRGRRDLGIVRRLEYPEKLRAISDGIFNRVVAALKAWAASIGDRAPEWFREQVKDAHHWRSHGHLTDLMREWEGKRFDADAEPDPELSAWMDAGDIERYGRPGGAFLSVQIWQRKDQHLWRWEDDQRSAALRSRQQIYREFAASVVKRFGTIAMANVNLAEVAMARRSYDDEKTAPDPVRSLRHMAAPHELRQAIVQAAVKSGCRVALVKPAKPKNGGASATEAERCAAILALARDPARKDEITWVFAEKKEAFWAKVARLKKEKREAEGAARKAEANAAE